MKYKRIRISTDVLIRLLRHDYCFTQENIPEDAKIINIYFQRELSNYTLWIVIESSEFNELVEGAEIPLLEVTMIMKN